MEENEQQSLLLLALSSVRSLLVVIEPSSSEVGGHVSPISQVLDPLEPGAASQFQKSVLHNGEVGSS